jgi:hypothetical protein
VSQTGSLRAAEWGAPWVGSVLEFWRCPENMHGRWAAVCFLILIQLGGKPVVCPHTLARPQPRLVLHAS